jgi:hypothetical protein
MRNGAISVMTCVTMRNTSHLSRNFGRENLLSIHVCGILPPVNIRTPQFYKFILIFAASNHDEFCGNLYIFSPSLISILFYSFLFQLLVCVIFFIIQIWIRVIDWLKFHGKLLTEIKVYLGKLSCKFKLCNNKNFFFSIFIDKTE